MTEREKCIAIIDNDILQKSDAIILLEGDGFNRYNKAVSLYKEGWSDKIIFSGGIVDYKYGSFPFSDVLPYLLKAGVESTSIIHENISKNTKEQAVEVIALARKNDWRRLILVASQEHQYRAYMTFLRQVMTLNTGTIIFNAPSRSLGWFCDDGWGIRFERLDDEFNKIERYSRNGDLATYEDVIKYQKWKEQLL
ncbi:MAG: YdcF family protein [Lachnospiraceae bacterium]|nr:YdcF family protein [Lachnospiraceae bacterium]